MQQETIKIRKKRRVRNRKNVLVIFMASALILLPPVMILITDYLFPPKIKQQMAIQKVSEPVATEIEEPETASSEINGRWYGLCPKNSVKTVEDFQAVVENDPVLSEHFADFDWDKASMGRLDSEIWTSVSYRKGDFIGKTRKKVRLPKGDGYISDGTRRVRTYCCNDYASDPPPTEAQAAPVFEKVESAVRRQELVAGPPAQQSSNAPAQQSSGPSRPAPLLLANPVVTPQLIKIPNIPEPSTFLLLGSGVAGFTAYQWLRRRRK